MAINPVQTALVGPSTVSLLTVQFSSNPAIGNACITKAWVIGHYDLVVSSVTVTDTDGNTYTQDTTTNYITGNGFSYVMYCFILRAVLTTTSRVIVTVQFNYTSASALVQSGASIDEYPTGSGISYDGAASATDDGTVGFATASLTTVHNSTLTICLAGGIFNSVSSSGWSIRDAWGTSGGVFTFVGEDRTSPSSGTSTSETSTSPYGSVVLLAQYLVVTNVNYVDSIQLGVGSHVADILGTTFDPVLGLGMASSNLGVTSGTFNPKSLIGTLDAMIGATLATFGITLPVGTSISTAEMMTTGMTQQQAMGISAAFLDLVTYSTSQSVPVAVGAGIVAFPTWSLNLRTAMAVSELIAGAVAVSLFGTSQVGVLELVSSSYSSSMSGVSLLGGIYGLLTDSQKAFIDSLAFGILQSFGADSGKAVEDSLSFGSSVRFQDIGSGIYSPQVAAGMLQGLNSQVRLDASTLSAMVALLSMSPSTVSSLGAVLGMIIGSSIVSHSGVSTSGVISLRDMYGILARIPEGTLPGLATVFAQLVYRSNLENKAPGAAISDAPVFKGEVNDI